MLFSVWAPAAERVELAVDGRNVRMEAHDAGWWRIDQPGLEHGHDYGYRIDGGERLPDPRSPWQPDGPLGPSRTVDHTRFRWSDGGWQAPPLSSAVIYELHIGTFTPQGTFAAAIERLDHLKQLGVTHVEIMPVADFVGSRGWGYDGVCLFAPQHAYGEPEDLKRLVDACHAAGLAVLLDVVYNHLGPTGNFLPRFGPYFTDKHHTAWGAAINFDGPQSDEVRRFFGDNAQSWLRDYHFDGLRLDAVHAIIDTSSLPFLEQLAIEVENLSAYLGRHFVLIAESDLNDPRIVRSREIGGFGLHAQWSDDIHHALHAALTGERSGYYLDFGELTHVDRALQRPYVYSGDHSVFRQRRHGRPPEGLSAHRFVACLQNHDQVGNRATGERIAQLAGLERAKVGAALVLLGPYVPMLFQGEEWAASSPFQYFVDFRDDPELARAVTNGRQHEFAGFGWKPEDVPDPQSPDTFERSKLRWEELGQGGHAEMLQWYQRLIALRKAKPYLTEGRLEEVRAQSDNDAQWLVVRRGPIAIVVSLVDGPTRVPLAEAERAKLLLASRAEVSTEEGFVTLCGPAVAVFETGTR